MGWFTSSPSITALLLNRRFLFNVLHRLATSVSTDISLEELRFRKSALLCYSPYCCGPNKLFSLTGVSRLLPIFTTSTCVFAYKMSLILRSCLVSDLTDNEIRQPSILTSTNMNEFWTQKKISYLKKFFLLEIHKIRSRTRTWGVFQFSFSSIKTGKILENREWSPGGQKHVCNQ